MDKIKRFWELQLCKNGSIIHKEQIKKYNILTTKYNKVSDKRHLNVYKDKSRLTNTLGEPDSLCGLLVVTRYRL